MARTYEEIINFIASGPSPQSLIDFRASDATRERVTDLIHRGREGQLSADEASELDHHLKLEHIMRLAKARARLTLKGIPA